MKIEGYFSNIKTANEVVARLKSEGLKGAFVDINEHMNDVYAERGVVGSGQISTLSGAVLGKSSTSGDGGNSPLAAASPMVSGMGSFEEIANIDCKVVVEVSDGNIENAKNIINRMDGTTDNPNVGIPEGIDNINEDALILKNLED
jgi:hypothetical protein